MIQPQIGVAVIVKWNDMFLLSKRISKHENDRYGVPGGKLDYGESLLDCANRELLEETDIRGWDTKPTGYISNNVYKDSHFLCVWFATEVFSVPGPDGSTEWGGKICFVEKDKDGNPKSHGWEWFTLEEVLKLPLMCSSYQAFVHYQNNGKFLLDHQKSDN